jgi:hypothetical protein
VQIKVSGSTCARGDHPVLTSSLAIRTNNEAVRGGARRPQERRQASRERDHSDRGRWTHHSHPGLPPRLLLHQPRLLARLRRRRRVNLHSPYDPEFSSTCRSTMHEACCTLTPVLNRTAQPIVAASTSRYSWRVSCRRASTTRVFSASVLRSRGRAQCPCGAVEGEEPAIPGAGVGALLRGVRVRRQGLLGRLFHTRLPPVFWLSRGFRPRFLPSKSCFTRPQRAEQDDPDRWLRRGLRLVCIHRADDLLVTSTLNRFPCRTVAATQVCGHT